jgi:hypothetical protein
VTGQQDGGAGVAQALDQAPQVQPRGHVDRGSGLVEHEQFGAMDQ